MMGFYWDYFPVYYKNKLKTGKNTELGNNNYQPLKMNRRLLTILNKYNK